MVTENENDGIKGYVRETEEERQRRLAIYRQGVAEIMAEELAARAAAKASAPTPPLHKIDGLTPEDNAYFGAPLTREGPSLITAAMGRLEPVQVFFEQGEGSDAEAAYLVDRAMAPDDQRYLVPLVYATEFEGQAGIAWAPVRFGPVVIEAGAFDQVWIEQAAVLDYVLGAERGKTSYGQNVDDPARPVLSALGVKLFGDPRKSDFVAAYTGKPLSQAMLDSLTTLQGDLALWQDVEEIAGQERTRSAKERVNELLFAGQIPSTE